MKATLRQLEYGTIFSYDGMTLRKTPTMGPCDPKMKKAGGNAYGFAYDLKVGGQFQTNRELQVWVSEQAEVSVD